MQFGAAQFKNNYAQMSDEELGLINRADLNDIARGCYDREVVKRAAARFSTEEEKAGICQEL
jgi:hypothetical protein